MVYYFLRHSAVLRRQKVSKMSAFTEVADVSTDAARKRLFNSVGIGLFGEDTRIPGVETRQTLDKTRLCYAEISRRLAEMPVSKIGLIEARVLDLILLSTLCCGKLAEGIPTKTFTYSVFTSGYSVERNPYGAVSSAFGRAIQIREAIKSLNSKGMIFKIKVRNTSWPSIYGVDLKRIHAFLSITLPQDIIMMKLLRENSLGRMERPEEKYTAAPERKRVRTKDLSRVYTVDKDLAVLYMRLYNK